MKEEWNFIIFLISRFTTVVIVEFLNFLSQQFLYSSVQVHLSASITLAY